MDCVGAVAGRTDPSVGWTKKLISTTALLAAGIEFFIFQQGGTLIFHRNPEFYGSSFRIYVTILFEQCAIKR